MARGGGEPRTPGSRGNRLPVGRSPELREGATGKVCGTSPRVGRKVKSSCRCSYGGAGFSLLFINLLRSWGWGIPGSEEGAGPACPGSERKLSCLPRELRSLPLLHPLSIETEEVRQGAPGVCRQLLEPSGQKRGPGRGTSTFSSSQEEGQGAPEMPVAASSQSPASDQSWGRGVPGGLSG